MKLLVKTIRYVIGGFWHGLSVCRVIVGNLIFLAILVFVLSIFFNVSEKAIPQKAALVLSLQGDIVIQKTASVFSGQLLGEPQREETLLKDVIDAIDYARDDQRIQALVLDLQDMGSSGTSKLQNIGETLKRFRESGKPIIASGDFFGQRQYYLAAHADRVYLHPMGGVVLTGFGLYRNYFKSALEKLLVRFHVFRVGSYKSALEPFLRDDMSGYAKEANSAWLNILWNSYKADVAGQRGLQPEAIDDFINNISNYLARVKGDSAKLARDYGLVDALKTRDQVRQELIALVGEDEDENTFRQVQFADYLAAIQPQRDKTRSGTPKVGIIIAKGIILDGVQPAGKIGGDTFTEIIRQVRRDDEIKALVLQIDSPGGSAFASEAIRREIELTRQAGKPVVVSMSSVAASGGYWIASSANEIWAAPTTITGSIGIFSAFPTFEKSLDYLGIHNDGVGTTRLADAFNPSRPLNPIAADALEQVIENNYNRFIQTVSKGRNMSPRDVEKVAQGRVWAGKTALGLGLIDRFGNLQDAARSAANMAGLKDFDVIYVEQPMTVREQLIKRLNQFLVNAFSNFSKPFTGPADRLYEDLGAEIRQISELKDPQSVYAYCMMCPSR
jgi:protease-4